MPTDHPIAEKPGCQICGTPFVPVYQDDVMVSVHCENGHTPMESVQRRAENFDAYIDGVLQPEARQKLREAERRFEDEILGL